MSEETEAMLQNYDDDDFIPPMSDNERNGLPSASPFRRFELCAGSYQLEQEAERLGQSAHKKSEEATRGDKIHARLAGEPVELSESETQSAELLKERADWQVERIFQGSEYKVLREKRLWLELDGKPALSGRFDRVVYTPEVALVQDFKTGWTEPDPAEQNAQMKVLAVLVGMHVPATLREVIVQIVSGPFGVTEARYDLPALAKAYGEIVATLRAINAPDAPFSPSPEACRYCGAKLICQAVRDMVAPMTKLQLSALPEDGPRAAKLLDEVTILRGLLDQIDEFYSAKFTDPTYAIPGYAMVPGNTIRQVTDWDTARSRLAEYLDANDIKGAANYRLGDLEKALGKVLKLKGNPLKDRMNQILDGLITEKQNAASLKRVSGKARLVEVTLP